MQMNNEYNNEKGITTWLRSFRVINSIINSVTPRKVTEWRLLNQNMASSLSERLTFTVNGHKSSTEPLNINFSLTRSVHKIQLHNGYFSSFKTPKRAHEFKMLGLNCARLTLCTVLRSSHHMINNLKRLDLRSIDEPSLILDLSNVEHLMELILLHGVRIKAIKPPVRGITKIIIRNYHIGNVNWDCFRDMRRKESLEGLELVEVHQSMIDLKNFINLKEFTEIDCSIDPANFTPPSTLKSLIKKGYTIPLKHYAKSFKTLEHLELIEIDEWVTVQECICKMHHLKYLKMSPYGLLGGFLVVEA